MITSWYKPADPLLTVSVMVKSVLLSYQFLSVTNLWAREGIDTNDHFNETTCMIGTICITYC